MLRLFLRLYLLLALGFAAAIFVVDHVIDAFYDSIVENYHRDAVRGQAYSLVEKLAPLDQAGRQRQLEDWRPHYGLELSLTDARQAKLTQEEQALLDKNLLVVREDFTEFISRIDAGPQLLDIKLPPEPSLTPLFTVLAYILLGVLVGIALLVWVRPHWRDLETLRLAAQRFGDGDLSSRTRIFRRSDIRTLAQHFNQMADRIESLISNQRELTNAVSHELHADLPPVLRTRAIEQAGRRRSTPRPDRGHARRSRRTGGNGLRTADLRPPGARQRREPPGNRRRRELAG